MVRKLFLSMGVILFSAVLAAAQEVTENKTSEDGVQPGAKELSGMSIVGNEETPKSLYIVPWKGSEMGTGSNLDMMLNENEGAVDRDVFKRQIDFYQVSTKK